MNKLKFGVVGPQVIKQPPAVAEEHWDQVDLQLVEDARGESKLRSLGAMDQHVLPVGGFPGLNHRPFDIGDVVDQWVLIVVTLGPVARENEDGHAVMVVPAPAASDVEGSAADDDRSGGHQLVEDLAASSRRPAGNA
jgi:hypothetical protein